MSEFDQEFFASTPNMTEKNSWSKFAVVSCVWQRPEKLAGTLVMLERQTDCDWDLHLVNNNFAVRRRVDKAVRESGVDAVITHNDRNRGSFAKIEMGHQLANAGYDWLIFIDDDFVFGADLVAALKRQRRVDALVAWRVWTIAGNYWQRKPTPVGQHGHCADSTGLIAPGAALRDTGVLALPRAHSAADNLWLCYYANHKLGMQIIQGQIDARIDVDGKDQYTRHIQMKTQLLERLRAEGWRVGCS